MEQEIKKGISPLIAIVTGILCLGFAGGGTWYVMSQKVKKAENQASDLDKRVAELEKIANEKPTVTPTPTPIVESPIKNELDELRNFCQGTDPDTLVGLIIYYENRDGKYGRCGIGQKDSPGGVTLISKRINDKWTKIWAGNGHVSEDLIIQHKIPSEISPYNQ